MDNVDLQLEQLARTDLAEEDQKIVLEWRQDLKQIHQDQEYLNLIQTKKIVLFLKEKIKFIDGVTTDLRWITSESLTSLNQLVCRRAIYQELLQTFQSEEELAQKKDSIAHQIEDGLTHINQ